MKKISIFILFFLALNITSISAQERMIVHMKDGSTIAYNMQDVEYVELEKHADSSQSHDSIPVVGGTNADAIDLGLSVKWADHNVGGSTTSDEGGRYAWTTASECGSFCGEGWRLPTDEEWQELNEKCKWEWTTRDGIGGRLVTGPSGMSVFFPATGLTIDNAKQVVGCMGIYWSASTIAGEAQSASGNYFDSANIYRMDFPRTTLFSVRLVKE